MNHDLSVRNIVKMTNLLAILERIESFSLISEIMICASYKVNCMWYNKATQIFLNREEEFVNMKFGQGKMISM